jgi:hypothetical protein
MGLFSTVRPENAERHSAYEKRRLNDRYLVTILITAIFLIAAACGSRSAAPASGNESNPYQDVQLTYQEASVTITGLSDGADLHVNLVKFTGNVSPDTTVFVNNTEGIVSEDGRYYALLDLSPGRNIIEVKTVRGDVTSIESIAVTFTPLLAVYLDWPDYDPNADYNKTPLTVTGTVNNPRARVTVNGYEVNVAEDGNFSTQVQLTPDHSDVQAIAKFGNEVDVAWLMFVLSDGKITPVPGQSLLDSSHTFVSQATVELAAGESSSIDFTLVVRKDVVRGFSEARFSITRVGQNDENELPMLSQLVAEVNPSNFTIYPNVDYHSTIAIKTSPGLASGEYYFLLKGHFGTDYSSDRITVVVN